MLRLDSLALLAGFSAAVSAASVTFTFYEGGWCQGKVQDGPIEWKDDQGTHNVVLIGEARRGAGSARVQCNDDQGDNFDCITAYYSGQYGKDLLGTFYGNGCVMFPGYIDSAGFFETGSPVSQKRSIDDEDAAVERGVAALNKREDLNPHQPGRYHFDPTYRLEWDPAPGQCPATTLEVNDALNHVSEQCRYDRGFARRGTIEVYGDVYEDFSGNPRHTLGVEYTLYESTSPYEASLWHSIWDSTFSRLYRNGGINHIGAITLFLYVQGRHVGSAVYNLRAND